MAACTKPEATNNGGSDNHGDGEDNKQPIIIIGQGQNTAPQIAAEGGNATFSFTASAAWTASADDVKASAWCTVSPAGGNAGEATITISAQPNTVPAAREAVVTIACGTSKQEIKVSQAAAKPTEDYTAYYKKNFWDRSDREQMGLNGPVKTIRVPNMNPYPEMVFDREGHLLEERHVNKDGTVSSHHVHTYDANGRRVRTEWQDGATVYTYEYGNGEKIVPLGLHFTWGQDLADVLHGDFGLPSDSDYYDLAPIKGLSRYCRYTSDYDAATNSFTEKLMEEITISFTGNTMTTTIVSYKGSGAAEEYGTSEGYTWTFEGNYPVSGEEKARNHYDDLVENSASITWRENGMPASTVRTYVRDWQYVKAGYDVTKILWHDNPRYLAVESIETNNTVYGNPNAFHVLFNSDYERISEGWDGSTPQTYQDYVFDAYGNWTERVAPYDYGGNWGVQNVKEYREITYFE